MTKEQLEVLNITQQALRAIVLALVAQLRISPAALSIALTAAGEETSLHDATRVMLLDMAEGMRVLSQLEGETSAPASH